MLEQNENTCKELVYGAVLAGGRSTRMGRDKRFLALNGELLVDRAINLVADSIGKGPESVYLCGDVPNRNCVPDAFSDLGPLGGILSAMLLVRSSAPASKAWLLVVPVDMPLLTSGQLRELISAAPCAHRSSCGVVAFEDNEIPLVIHCDSFAEGILTEICWSALPSGRSIRTLQDRLGVHRIPLKQGGFNSMLNANSPQDWKRVCESGVS